ncbi:unnamed protein product [Durusdinium trenchii]|uniref:G domain-containing protein n=1 Tax=Durusdinium trenchii TaxID=1381693 RepID=A0ABP0LGP8_9DINO
MASSHDLDLWKFMINGNCFRKLVDTTASAVLVVGPMGAGKSTTIGIQTGAKYEAVKEEVDGRLKKVYRCVQSDNRRPQTGDGYTSKTLNIGLYVAEERYGGYSYLDTAGLNEDRTDTHRMWTQWSLATSFSLLPKIKCVILVMDFRSLVSERGFGMRATAKSLAPITGSGEASRHFYDSMIFLFTNAYEDGERVQAESIIKIARTQLSEQKKLWEQHYRQVDAQSRADDPQIQERVAILTFLKTLAEANGRVHVCFPDTPAQSESQRLMVQKMIGKSAAITKEMLTDIVATRPTSNLEVLQMFAKLATEPDSRLGGKSYTEMLRQRADHLQQLVRLKEKHKERLQAIESDWQSVQRDMLSTLWKNRDELSQQKRLAEERMNQLKMSEAPTVIATKEVKKSHPTSGWWIFFMFGGGWGWGKQSARETLDYRDAWFSKYEIKGGDYTKDIKEHDSGKGLLKIDFTSTEGVDLNVEVRFFRPEKDTEETTRLIASLERQVQDLTSQIQDCDVKMVAFQGADSQKALVALIMTEKDQLEHADQDLVEQLDRTAVQPSDDFPQAPSQWSVLTNLRGVLSVLIEKQMLPVDLAASTREPIESFLHAWDHVQKLLRELERGPGSSAISLKSSTVSSHIEDAPPVKPSLRAIARLSWAHFCAESAIDKARLVLEGLMRQRVALATALFTYAVLLKVSPSDTLQGAFANLLLALSVYIVALKILSDGVHEASMIAMSCKHQVDSYLSCLSLWSGAKLRDAGHAGSDLATSIAERLGNALSNMKPFVKIC